MRRLIFTSMLCLFSLPAQAVVVDVVIRGTVSTLTDLSSGTFNVFGAALIPGAAYTARFTYDTSLGTRSDNLGGLTADVLSGGAAGQSGSPVSATLTVGQVRHDILGSSTLPDVRDTAIVYVLPQDRDPVFPPDVIDTSNPRPNLAVYGAFAQAYDSTFNRSDYGELRFSLAGMVGTFPDSLETPYTLAIRPNPNNSNAIPAGFGFWGLGFQDRAEGTFGFVGAGLGISRVTVRQRDVVTPTPVPLPASAWLLFGAIACLVLPGRRSRGGAAVA